jgi:hypothetical protein
MISHAEASMFFDALLNRLQKFVEEEGYIYPILILLKKGEPFGEVEYQHPTVVNIETVDVVPAGDETIYRLNVGMKMENLEDDKQIPKIAQDLVKITNADAIGIVIGCVYREIPVGDEPEEEEIYRDPDSIKILNHCYYLKEDPQCFMRMIPYVNRGPVKKPDGFLDTGSKGPYEVLFVNFPWMKPTQYNKAKLSDPYER